jgi:hypothetical protein
MVVGFFMEGSGDEKSDDGQAGLRLLDSYNTSFWSNFTNFTEEEDFASQFVAASDISVDAVVTAFYWNAIAFVVLMVTYECLRRLLPAVYSSQIRRQFKAGVVDPTEDRSDDSPTRPFVHVRTPSAASVDRSVDRSLPDIISPYWVSSVLSVSWNTIRKYSGLDGYFFLRVSSKMFCPFLQNKSRTNTRIHDLQQN